MPGTAVGKRAYFVRRFDAGDLLDVFLVTAVATLLAIRFFLAATDYPQVSGAGNVLHIAHMLWGGVGMMAALVVVFAFQGHLWMLIAAAGGGAGFGTFIDELGKFITKDNNYFFRPTIAIIYLIFVAMYLAFRSLGRIRRISDEERVVNALDLTKEAAMRDLRPREVNAALDLLAGCDPRDPTVVALQNVLLQTPAGDDAAPGLAERVTAWVQRIYLRLITWRWFRVLFIGVFVLISLGALATALVRVAGLTLGELQGGWSAISSSELVAVGQLVSALAVGILTVIGVVRWRNQPLAAFRWFARAVLVQIFLGQFFEFYEDQLGAILGLAALLLLWASLRLMISGELTRASHTTTAG